MNNNLKKRFATAAATVAVLGGIGLAGAVPAQAATTSTSVWDAVASCESSGDWSINTGNGFYGGLQFSQSTWDEFGGQAYASRADLATKDQQIAIAQKVLAVQGPTAWPVCSVVAGLTSSNGGTTTDTSALASTAVSSSSSSDTSSVASDTSTTSSDSSAATSTSDSSASSDSTSATSTDSSASSDQSSTAQGNAQSKAAKAHKSVHRHHHTPQSDQ